MRPRVLLLLALLLGALPPAGASVAHAAVPSLAGTTVVTGSHLARAVVDLRRWATVDLGLPPLSDVPGAAVSGDGRLTGVLLVRRDGDRGLTRLWVSRAGLCSRAGCRPVRGGALHAWGVTRDGKLSSSVSELAPGRYDLYLLADGRPVTVTLRLQGLTGRATVRPAAVRGASLWTPEPTVRALPGGSTLGSFGATRQAVLPRRGLVHQQTWVVGAEWQHDLRACWAVQEPESSAPRSPTPCPGPVDLQQPSGTTGGPGASPPCLSACFVTGERGASRSGTLQWTWLDRAAPLHVGAQGTYRVVDGAAQVLTLVLPAA